MKLALVIVTIVLIAAGCSRVETRPVMIKPVCNKPQLQALPDIDAAELYHRVGDSMYYQLELRENRITTWALQLESIVDRVCE